MPFGFNGPFASMFGGQTTNGGTGWTPGKFMGSLGGGMGGQTTGGGPFMQMLQGKGMVMSAMADGTLGQGGIQSRIQAGQGPLQTLMKGYGGSTETGADAALPATQGVYKTKGGPVNVTY